MNRYNPAEIEPKWQKIWDESKVYETDLKTAKPKYLAMSMFNYPSGAGIHIGHAMNYTISDVKARFKRQQGYESYHPVGWDAFGLPAENYAIKSGVSPQASMAEIIPGYHKQYKAMGWSNDWDKEIATHTPEYYRWTQWIFAEMYKNGLAYQDARLQWWCEADKTVLSNEQVIDGKCWRHDGPDDPLVEQREVNQWFFKITDYADELLEATDALDWTESVKLAQKNWIGKSVGAEIVFELEGTDPDITVFTTRPDTLFGATFLVIAPEHELVTVLTTAEQKDAVDAYVKTTQKKSELERQTGKEKTGVFTGAYALNPVNGERVPVWIADYVLTGYGTGAIMAVPAHDERDHEFAKAFELPIRRVVQNEATDDECTHDEGVLMNSGAFDGTPTEQARELIIQHLAREKKATEKVNYRMRDWSVSRQRYWGAPIPIIHCATCGPQLVPDNELPVVLPELDDFQPSGDGRSALARAADWLNVTCPKCDGPAERETDTLDTYIDSSWYMFRYLDPHNEDKIFDSEIANAWGPVDFYNGADHATAHMLYARFITRFFHKLGLLDNPEPFTQFLFNGKVTASDGAMFSKSKGNGVDPLEIINQGYGADALRTYLMFAAPLELWAKWDPQGVPGTHRFLSRLWNVAQEYSAAPAGELDEQLGRRVRIGTHQMIKKMTIDIEENRYNTAIAAAMARVNELYKLKVDNLVQSTEWLEALEALIACIAPFAPHTADELWHQIGHEDSVQRDSWPKWDEALTIDDTITIAVQINGKVRAEVQVPKDASREDLEAAALQNDKITELLGESQPKRVIVVPGRLVNIVV
jgi:leucyl-tRNA synthetase